MKALAERFGAEPAEIRRLLDGHLEVGRTRELADMMRAAGVRASRPADDAFSAPCAGRRQSALGLTQFELKT